MRDKTADTNSNSYLRERACRVDIESMNLCPPAKGQSLYSGRRTLRDAKSNDDACKYVQEEVYWNKSRKKVVDARRLEGDPMDTL